MSPTTSSSPENPARRPFSARNVYISIRFMPVSSNIDRAGGVVVRLTSAGDYYLARANALENNVQLYRVVGGKRQMIAGVDAPWQAAPGTRSELRRETTASSYCSTTGSCSAPPTQRS
jgi:hypothetical protein